jgi:hypothetical protein
MIKFILILFFPLWIYSQGSLVVSSGTNIVSTNNPIVNLYNTDLYNSSSSNLGLKTIWGFTGTIPQTIYGTYINSFYGLRLNNTNGFSLLSNTTISDRLDMVNGDISLNSYNLEIGTSTTNTGEINWVSGTIIGSLKRWFAPSTNLTQSTGIFPIGNTTTNRNVIINYTQAPTDGGYIIVEYKNGIPSMVDTYSGLPLWSSDNQLIQNYENQGYFDITPFDYSSSLNTKQYKLTMRGNGLTTVYDRSFIRLIKSSGPTHTNWVTCGTHTSINGTSNNDFTVTSDNVIGFSWFNFGSQNVNPLPVELIEFEGYPYQQWNVIKWTTASEHNSSYFDLEMSLDGFIWKSISIKDAAYNSTTEIKYSFIDYNLNELTYYRLNQYDIDGEFKIYGPITVFKQIKDKKIVKYINLLGQEVDQQTKGLLLEIYDDGTIRKIIN